MPTSRREILRTGTLAAAAMLASPFFTWAQATAAADAKPGKGKKVLLFTKSQYFPHEAVTRKPKDDGTPGDTLAWGEQYFHDWATAAGYEVTISKEGNFFTPENVDKFDAFAFYTCGDLTQPPGTKYPNNDKTSPMTEAGKGALLKAIEAGKGFIGLHSASDTFNIASHNAYPVKILPKGEKIDPFCMMLGAEFTSHASQQEATVRVGSKAFPGLTDIQEFTTTEEWYAFTNMSPDLHVIFVQDTSTMKLVNGQREAPYRGDPYPNTWARLHGKGRVFYTSLGHREDVWTRPLYKQMVLAALAWSTRVVENDVKPNFAQACPKIWAAGGTATQP